MTENRRQRTEDGNPTSDFRLLIRWAVD